MRKYKAACDKCKWTCEHEKELVVKQKLGFHRRSAHGIEGVSARPGAKRLAAREAYWRKSGYSEEDIAQKRAAYNAKHARDATSATGLEPIRKQPRREAQPLALSECPCCGARFFITKKDSDET